MPTPTREQLASIEWRGDHPEYTSCPACDGGYLNHKSDCWLAACLTVPPPEPQAMPPIEPGDMIVYETRSREKINRVVTATGAPNWNDQLRHMVTAHYKPVWTREPRR